LKEKEMKKLASFVALVMLLTAAASAEAQNRRSGGRQGPGAGRSGNSKSQFLPPGFDWGRLLPPGGQAPQPLPQPQPQPQQPKVFYEVMEIQPFDNSVVERKLFPRRDQAVAFQNRVQNKYWVMEKATHLSPPKYTEFATYGEAAAYQSSLNVLFGPVNELRRGRASGITPLDADTIGSFAKSNAAKTQPTNSGGNRRSGASRRSR
jgi:hypothetical protein